MMLRKQQYIAWTLAVVSSLLSVAFWLHAGLDEIAFQRVSPASIVEMRLKKVSPPLHASAPSEESALPEEILPTEIPAAQATKGQLQEWELRKAYALRIPSLGIRAPVLLPSRTYWDKQEWVALEEQMQAGMLHGTVAYPHSSRPGAGGVLYVAGHSSPPSQRAKESVFGSVFARLPEIAVGEEIMITDGDERFTYAVRDVFVVSADDTRILATGKEEGVLTLITCYPVGSTRQRFVVKAKRVE